MGKQAFTDVTGQTGVNNSGWEPAAFLDYDNDGYLDLCLQLPQL